MLSFSFLRLVVGWFGVLVSAFIFGRFSDYLIHISLRFQELIYCQFYFIYVS